jgi:hypothetical protein
MFMRNYYNALTFSGDNGTMSAAMPNWSWTMNEWIQAVAVRRGNTLSVYQNTVKGTDDTSAGADLSSTNDWCIGARGYDKYYGLAGGISHLIIWNRALTESEIAQLYREPFCIFEKPIISSMFYATETSDWLDIGSSNLYDHCGDSWGAFLTEALDGDDCWMHDVAEVHHFILDLGSVYNISKVRGRSNCTWVQQDPTNVNIYVSNSTSVWGTAVASNITTWQDTYDWVEVECTPKNGRYIKVEITSTEDGSPGSITFGIDEEDPPYMTIFDAYGSYVSGGGHPQIILIQMGAIPLFILALCFITKKRK